MRLISKVCLLVLSGFGRAKNNPAAAGVFSLALLLFLPCCMRAQMITGSEMGDFTSTFGISNKGWSVQQTSCSPGANALWPAEEAAFTFFLKPGLALKGEKHVDWDLWQHKDLGNFTGSFETLVLARGAVMIKARAERGKLS